MCVHACVCVCVFGKTFYPLKIWRSGFGGGGGGQGRIQGGGGGSLGSKDPPLAPSNE